MSKTKFDISVVSGKVTAASKKIIESILKDAHQRAVSRVPVRTGNLRDSIYVTPDSIGASAEYASYVEYGTAKQAPTYFLTSSINEAISSSGGK
jgi:hypothetical protein